MFIGYYQFLNHRMDFIIPSIEAEFQRETTVENTCSIISQCYFILWMMGKRRRFSMACLIVGAFVLTEALFIQWEHHGTWDKRGI